MFYLLLFSKETINLITFDQNLKTPMFSNSLLTNLSAFVGRVIFT